METLVVYDITDDPTRYKIAEVLKDYGFERIQKSAFLGDLNRNRREMLLLDLRKVLGEEVGHIQLVPVCNKCRRLKKEVGERQYDFGE